MKQHYVKTSNHHRFMAAVSAVETRGSPEACILLLTGAPGTGKSCTVDKWGSDNDAILIEGIPGMGVTYVRDYLAHQTGVAERRRFAQDKGFVDHFKRTGQPIILDEAQHGLPDKAACIEYLRRVCEQAKTMLVLVCHTSEKYRFGEERLAHIATRVTAAPTLQLAGVEDVAAYLAELCEVAADAEVVRLVHEHSGGRYRLLANAGRTLEAIAAKKGLKQLAAADVKGIRLCEDVMRSVKRRAA